MLSPYNSTYLKVTYTALSLYNLKTFVYRYFVNDDTSALIAIAFIMLLLVLVPKILIKPITPLFSVIDITIDGFMADTKSYI